MDYVIVNGELYHYGVPGMRWGVRKTSYVPGVQYSDRQKKKFKRQAVSILKGQSKEAKNYSKIMDNKSTRDYKMADKHVWTSEKAQARNDQEKFQKYQAKAWKKMGSSIQAGQKSVEYLKRSQALDKKLSDIASDKIKAGRDYVVNKSVDIGVDIPLGSVLYVNRRIDYK